MVPSLEAVNFIPSSTEELSFSLVTAGRSLGENRFTGVLPPDAATESETFAVAVPPWPSEIV